MFNPKEKNYNIQTSSKQERDAIAKMLYDEYKIRWTSGTTKDWDRYPWLVIMNGVLYQNDGQHGGFEVIQSGSIMSCKRCHHSPEYCTCGGNG